MAPYYFLINETKKEQIHLDSHIKDSPMRHNKAVHLAIMNYIMDNSGDELRLYSDQSERVYEDDLKEVDLLKYPFSDDIQQEIVRILNSIYGKTKYKIENGEIKSKIEML